MVPGQANKTDDLTLHRYYAVYKCLDKRRHYFHTQIVIIVIIVI